MWQRMRHPATWVSKLYERDPTDARQSATQAAGSPLANVCDTNYTSIVKMPKRYLRNLAYAGVHVPLKSLAASL